MKALMFSFEEHLNVCDTIKVGVSKDNQKFWAYKEVVHESGHFGHELARLNQG